MKIQALEKLASYTNKMPMRKSIGFVSEPAIIHNKGYFKLATGLNGDTCSFSKYDRSLDPEFLRKLLNIEEKTPLETYAKITTEMLKAMGYKHPKALGISVTDKCHCLAYSYLKGEIQINPYYLGKDADKRIVIEAIRHELDHMDKAVKLYKSIGEDKFFDSQCKKFNLPEETIAIFKDRWYKSFYKLMSKDVSLDGFDTQKYLNSKQVHHEFPDYWYNMSAYCNDIWEKEAYKTEDVVKRILGAPGEQCMEWFKRQNRIYMKIMDEQNIPLRKRYAIIDDLYSLVYMKLANENPDNIRKCIKIAENIRSGKHNYTVQDLNFIKEIRKKVPRRTQVMQSSCDKQVEKLLREGKTVDDILKDM